MVDRSSTSELDSAADAIDDRDVKRHVAADAAAWGVVTATNNAMAGPLLLAHGASNMVFGVYNAAMSFFGLGTALTGLRLTGDRSSGATAFRLFLVARSVLLLLPISLIMLSSAPVELLIGILVLWAAAEGAAQPLWLSHLSGLGGDENRGARLARRSARASGAGLLVLVPVLLMLAAGSTNHALIVAYGGAAFVGLLGLRPVRLLSSRSSSQTLPQQLRFPDGLSVRFLFAISLFWFGAALNRPVLPVWISGELGAPPLYFAAAAIAAAASGMLVPRWWGKCADAHGSSALLVLTGMTASVVPWLWIVAPAWWLGVPIEMIAAGCWLGHLLGLMLRCIEMAPDESARPAFIAWTQTVQGLGATSAPLVASLMAGLLGARAVLVTSGALCLIATTQMATAGSTISTTALTRQLMASLASWTTNRELVSTPQFALEGSGSIPAPVSSPAYRPRRKSAESISLRRVLLADCQSCAGLGCSSCLGTGLAA